MEINKTYNNIKNPQTKIRYAGFWIRVGAALIDFVVLLPIIGIGIYNTLHTKQIIPAILVILLTSIYKPLMEYYYGATVGKMAVKIKVVDVAFKKIGLATSIKRYLPWIIANTASIIVTIIMYSDIEFEMVTAFTEVREFQRAKGYDFYLKLAKSGIYASIGALIVSDKKQGLHDLYAGTYCIYK